MNENQQVSKFFILGNPRSGTTILRLMLDAHPAVVVPPECGFMIWFFEKYHEINFQENSIEKISGFVEDLKSARKIDNWRLDFRMLQTFLIKNRPTNYSELISMVYIFYAGNKRADIRMWGDKNNFYIGHIPELVELYPTAKFIHLIRDGRDVACSYKELNSKQINSKYAPKLESEIDVIAHEWCDNNQKIKIDLERYSTPSNHILLKYEDLILSPYHELKRISQFLGIEYHPQMLDYHRVSKTYEPDEYLQWKKNTKKPLQPDGIGRFKKDLTQQELKTFTVIAEQCLSDYFYKD